MINIKKEVDKNEKREIDNNGKLIEIKI